mmetsp:Transcript_26399/g.45928  ORF Transcript_26399/g.45928 Transcript_26399/m.45928 type:complete len:443 (-) Transcript_26399:32-1360(-)
MHTETNLGDGGPIWIKSENAVPADLCAHLAKYIDDEVFSVAGTGLQPLSTVDSNDVDVVRQVWEHTQALVPTSFEGCALVGPHPTVRLLQYTALLHDASPDMHHPAHADTPLASPGGSVRFYGIGGTHGQPNVDVHPSQGMMLIFDHRVHHRAAAVTSGTKHVVKLSVLYALQPDIPFSTNQVSVTKADQDVRVAFSICRRVAAVFSRGPLAQHTFEFVGTKEDEFLALVRRAESEKERVALEGARGQLLDFILLHDLTSWPKQLVGRAFMVMIAALVDPRFKLRAYQAFKVATQLHNDERCLLLGETLIKDASDPDPNVRLAAIDAFFCLFDFDEECRGQVIAHAIRCDPSPFVRLRALQGLVDLAEDVGKHEAIEGRAESAAALWDRYGDSLLQAASPVPSTQAEARECDEIAAKALAIRAIALLSPLKEKHSHDFSLLD